MKAQFFHLPQTFIISVIITGFCLFNSFAGAAPYIYQHKLGDSTQFKAEMVSQSDSIVLNGNIKKVFPLFGAFEERKWAEGWNPTLLYMATDTIQEGTTFKTKGHLGESEYTWRINKYDPKNCSIQYLVISPNRYWTITVKCAKAGREKTMTTITYTFIGLNELGNHLDRHALTIMYAQHLKDWQQAINDYLAKN